MYTNRYIITALVPEPLKASLAAMRKQHDTFCRQWLPPHITIIPPFDADLSKGDRELIKNIKVSITTPFEGWGSYRRQYSSVLFAKLPDHSFDQFRNTAFDLVPTLPPLATNDPGYHVTVVSRIPNELFDEVEKKVTMKELSGEFTVDHLTLYAWDDYVRQWIEIM